MIDYNELSIDSHYNENKFVAPPNQNLQIYTNLLPQHTTNTIVQHPSPKVNVAYDTL